MKANLLAVLLILSQQVFSQNAEFERFAEEHDLYGAKVLNKPAPLFKLMSLDSQWIDLGALRGKVVLLDFWSLGCGSCFKEIPVLNELVGAYPAEQLVIISLMDNSREQISLRFKGSANGYKMEEPIYNNDLIDYQIIPDSGEIMKLYTYKLAFPRIFIIDQDGIVYFHEVGFADERGIPGEITTKQKLNRVIRQLLQ